MDYSRFIAIGLVLISSPEPSVTRVCVNKFCSLASDDATLRTTNVGTTSSVAIEQQRTQVV